MLEYELWGNTLESWGISILIILGAVVVVKLISLFSRKVLKPSPVRQTIWIMLFITPSNHP